MGCGRHFQLKYLWKWTGKMEEVKDEELKGEDVED